MIDIKKIPILPIAIVITIVAVALVAYKIERTWKTAKVTSDNQTLRIIDGGQHGPTTIFSHYIPNPDASSIATNSLLGSNEAYSSQNIYAIPTGDISKGGTGANKVYYYDSTRVPDFLLGPAQVRQIDLTRQNEALYGNLGNPLIEGQFQSLFSSYPV